MNLSSFSFAWRLESIYLLSLAYACFLILSTSRLNRIFSSSGDVLTALFFFSGLYRISGSLTLLLWEAFISEGVRLNLASCSLTTSGRNCLCPYGFTFRTSSWWRFSLRSWFYSAAETSFWFIKVAWAIYFLIISALIRFWSTVFFKVWKYSFLNLVWYSALVWNSC